MILIIVVAALVLLSLPAALISKIFEQVSPMGRINLLNEVRWAGEIIFWSLTYLVAAIIVATLGAWWEGTIAAIWFGGVAVTMAKEWYQYRKEITEVFCKAWKRKNDLRGWL